MTNYNPNATQAEKLAAYLNEKRLREEPPAPATYHSMARHWR
jgi:hypothetical protein